MDRRRVLTGSAAIAAVGVSMMAGRVTGQEKGKGKGDGKGPPQPPAPPKPWKDEIVGAWALLIIDGIKADGTHQPLYGPNPKGMAIFTADGRYSQQVMRDVRPKFAANDRLKGTPEELKAAIEGINTQFGTYTVDEANKKLRMRIEGSSFPNWDGTTLELNVSALAADEFVWSNNPSTIIPSLGFPRVELAWHRIK
jgi:Lipocalin-like domain